MNGPRDYHTLGKSGRERQIPYDTTYMWNLNYDTKELIYRRETDSQTERTDLDLPRWGKRKGWGETDWDSQIQTIIYRINNRVLLYSTGNYTQDLVTNHTGKEHICACVCVCVYIYIYMNHSDVQ